MSDYKYTSRFPFLQFSVGVLLSFASELRGVPRHSAIFYVEHVFVSA
jgi:hypothetical protein